MSDVATTPISTPTQLAQELEAIIQRLDANRMQEPYCSLLRGTLERINRHVRSTGHDLRSPNALLDSPQLHLIHGDEISEVTLIRRSNGALMIVSPIWLKEREIISLREKELVNVSEYTCSVTHCRRGYRNSDFDSPYYVCLQTLSATTH